MKAIVVVLLLCVTRTLTEDSFDSSGVKVALKVYDECSRGDIFFCLKKKAAVMLDRLSRMEKISIIDGVTIVKAVDASQVKSNSTDDSERNMAKNESVDEMFANKLTRLIGSRKLEISLPKVLPALEQVGNYDTNRQARGDFDLSSAFGGGGGGGGHGGGGGGHGGGGGGGGHGGGGGGGGGGGKKKKGGNQMNGMMMLMAAKMSALGAMAIGTLFLLAKKALITAKIALLISGIIALKKLLANKGGGTKVQDVWATQSSHGGGGGGHGGWAPSGGGGGGGGWDKKSYNSLPYNAYAPDKYV